MRMVTRILQPCFIVLWSMVQTQVQGSCTFPTELSGVWISSDRGVVRFNSSFILGYPLTFPALKRTDFECYMVNGTTFILRATDTTTIFGAIFRLYSCLEFVKIDESSFIYYEKTEFEPYAEDRLLVVEQSENVSLLQVCNRPSSSPGSAITLVKNTSLENGLASVRCPLELLSTFTNISVTLSGMQSYCIESVLDGCQNETFIHFLLDPSCESSSKLSDDVLLHCIYHESVDDVTYLYTWTNEGSLLPTSPYGFICLEVRTAEYSSRISLYPEYCADSKLSSPFIEFEVSNINYTCDGITTTPTTSSEITVKSDGDEKEKKTSWVLYFVIALCSVLAVLAILVTFHCYRKQMFKRCQQKASGDSAMTNIQTVKI